MQEDEADAIFDSLSSSSSISSLSNDNVNENSNKEINDEEKEREEHPERFADLCDSYGNPIPKEKRNIKTTSEITKQKDNANKIISYYKDSYKDITIDSLYVNDLKFLTELKEYDKLVSIVNKKDDLISIESIILANYKEVLNET